MPATRSLLGALTLCVQLAATPREEDLPREGHEATQLVSVLDNGRFDHPVPGFLDEAGVRRIPWWRTSAGAEQIVGQEGDRYLRTRGDEWASQPIPAFAPLADRLVLRGRVRGDAVVELRAECGTLEVHASSSSNGFEPFEITGADLAAACGTRPVPRFELVLRSDPRGSRPAHWKDLEAWIELPLPTEAELRAEILVHLHWIFELWLERGLDLEGAVATRFLVHQHDVVTGERLRDIKASFSKFYSVLLDALEYEEVPAWRTALERYVDSYLRHALHPETGLPRNWDALADEPLDERGLEIGAPFGFLIDVAERGPSGQREAATRAAARIGETLLEHGVLPDGSVAARYRPRDALLDTATAPLRRLDVPAQLARLSALTGDERFAHAARRAVARLEFTHAWAGDWEHIDPGFDDQFGYYAARLITLWRADADVEVYRRLTRKGFDYYAPRWFEATRLGAFVASDQVRCWSIAQQLAELDADVRQRTPSLLQAAYRAHFKSQQLPDGTWAETSHYAFDPKVNVEIGDLHAIPSNLLYGLAAIYDESLGARQVEVRGMFASVLRSTVETYRRPHGYLGTLAEGRIQNPAGASIRLAASLTEMLRRLAGT